MFLIFERYRKALLMKTITRMEEMILLAILHLESNAYLVAIQDYLSDITNKKISLTSVHLPLSRLEKIKYLESEMGEATAVRGGRRKKIYRVTEEGLEALEKQRDLSNRLWNNYPGMDTRG
jgi:DNA-binding PadR family transcriptional regulator